MEAVVLHGLGDYRNEMVPIPEPGFQEVLIKVEAVGICASDAKVFIGAEKYWGKQGKIWPIQSQKCKSSNLAFRTRKVSNGFTPNTWP